jgi:antitoxin component YwqK of YwqJK toxin-antitoxin module
MEVVRTYYDEGQLKEEYCLINNKKEGLYKKYHKNGQLYEICNYVDGKENGEFKRYSIDGILFYKKKMIILMNIY